MSEEGRPSSHRRDDDGNDDEGRGSGTRDNGESGENLDGQEVANEKAETLRTLRTTNPRHLHFFKTKSNDLDRIDEVEDDEPEISATLAALAPIEDNNDSMNLSISLHDVSNHTAAALSLGLQESSDVSISVVSDLFEEPTLPGAFSVTGPRPEDISTAEESNANLIDDTDYESNHSPPVAPEEPESVLATANPVSELPHARPEQDDIAASQHERRKSTEHKSIRDMRAMRSCIVVALLVMFITVVLSFHLQNQSKDQPEAGRSNRPGHIDPNLGAVPRKDYLLSLLPEYTKDALGVTTDNNPNASLVMTPLPFAMLSPQAKAFAWTINDPIFDSYEPWKLQQRFALACFYYATGGETSWNSRENWLSYNPNVWEEHWFSKTYPTPDHHWISWHSLYPLVVEEPSQEFNHLWLIQNGLQGTLPPELFLLTSLRSLDLTLNPLLGGTIPSEIGNLHRMEILMFLDSTMTGELPTELGQLSNLLGLYAQSNYFHGGIPSQVSLLQDLIVLDLASSNLSGPIPSELGLISPLGIWLEENELDSHIPTEIGLTKTQLLSIHGNLLTGTIPSQLGMLLDDPWLYKDKYATLMEKKAPKVGVDFVLDIVVHVLDVGFTGVMMHQNLLTGSIPTELGTFSEGEVLNLAQNSLTGAIPSELGLLSNLLWLGLSENQLSGQIPSEVGLLSNLKYLLLHQNPLTGLLPDLGSLVSHGNLGGITINATGITGTIPDELCELGQWNFSSWLGLSFDCSEGLCGCDWCPCAGIERSHGAP